MLHIVHNILSVEACVVLFLAQVIEIKEKEVNETYYELIEITGKIVAALICSNLGGE
jgi:hypothetical protein